MNVCRRLGAQSVLWNGNRESLKTSFWGRDSLVAFALRTYGERRAQWPALLAPYRCARFESTIDVERFVASF